MKLKLIFMIFFVFILGCQQYDEGVSEEETSIEIISEETIIEEVDGEFDDGLDEALKELEEIEDI